MNHIWSQTCPCGLCRVIKLVLKTTGDMGDMRNMSKKIILIFNTGFILHKKPVWMKGANEVKVKPACIPSIPRGSQYSPMKGLFIVSGMTWTQTMLWLVWCTFLHRSSRDKSAGVTGVQILYTHKMDKLLPTYKNTRKWDWIRWL